MYIITFKKYTSTKKELFKLKRQHNHLKINYDNLDKKIRDISNQNIILESLLRKYREEKNNV